jgi:hypothetical protein
VIRPVQSLSTSPSTVRSSPLRRGAGGRLAAPLGTALAALAAVGYVGAVDPNQAGHYPTCPFLAVTGLYCPGCGSLRVLHALANGHLGEAFGHNVLTTLAVPWLVLSWVLWTRRRLTGTGRAWAAPGRLVWVLLGVIVAFWVLRNLPGFAILAP